MICAMPCKPRRQSSPPWTLASELKIILPELEKPLGRGGAGRFRLEVPKS